MERPPIYSYEAQDSPRYQRDDEPVADRGWRATTSFHLLCHSVGISFLISTSCAYDFDSNIVGHLRAKHLVIALKAVFHHFV
jgi:hypothetical protein